MHRLLGNLPSRRDNSRAAIENRAVDESNEFPGQIAASLAIGFALGHELKVV